MNKRDLQKEQLLEELAKRFRDSAHTLKSVARRINEASQMHQNTVRRMEHASESLRRSVDGNTAPLSFSYLEFLEFSNAAEFRKFKKMKVITDEEIKNIDWDELAQKLLGAA